MRYRTFTGTDLRVSEIGFGVWSVATNWWGVGDPRLARDLLAEAYDLGINFYDTADVYGQGRGETLLGEVFGDRRSEVVIATKFGYDIYSHPGERSGHSELPQDWSPSFIRHACEQSLARLSTDYIDLYQLHNPRLDAITDPEVWSTLEDLQREGKIRYFGVALGPDIGWRDEGLAAISGGHAHMLQVIYNALEREPAEELLAASQRAGISCAARVPHASGILDGSYDPTRHFDRTDHRSHRPRPWMAAGVAVRDQMSLRSGRTLGQTALRFCLVPPGVATVLPNITSHENLREFAVAGDAPPLEPDEIAVLARAWHEHGADLSQPFSDSRSKPAKLVSR